jgi:hypothetical protein
MLWALVLFVLIAKVNAHFNMVGVAINNQLRVDCLRDISQYGANNDPVVNVLSEDFTCNPFGKQRAKSSCIVKRKYSVDSLR